MGKQIKGIVMNQRVRGGLTILLIALVLCLYLKIRSSRVVVTREEKSAAEPPEVIKALVVKKNDSDVVAKGRLLEPIIDGIKTFVFFLGHARSGHSIVGSLLDSHPHVVIAHEFDIFAKLSSERFLTPTKPQIFNALWKNAKRAVITGKRAEPTNRKGYTLLVDGLYQGTYADHIDVIGDKKAGSTTKMLVDQPADWSNVLTTLSSFVDTLKVIHVIRNPYDNIATSILYTSSLRHNFGNTKRSNQTYQIDPDTIKQEIECYFTYHQAIVDAKKTYNLNMVTIHGKDLISDPRGTLLKLCNHLGVNCSNNYLEICSNKVYKTESRTRRLIKWTDEQLRMIQENIEKYGILKDYSFDSM